MESRKGTPFFFCDFTWLHPPELTYEFYFIQAGLFHPQESLGVPQQIPLGSKCMLGT